MKEYITVGTAQAKHSAKKPLRSDGFHLCSAIILDSDNGTYLAHAIPENAIGDKDNSSAMNIKKTISNLLTTPELSNISPKNIRAYINGGNEKDLSFLIETCRDLGISIIEANLDKSPMYPAPTSHGCRYVIFDPKSKEFSIDYN